MLRAGKVGCESKLFGATRRPKSGSRDGTRSRKLHIGKSSRSVQTDFRNSTGSHRTQTEGQDCGELATSGRRMLSSKCNNIRVTSISTTTSASPALLAPSHAASSCGSRPVNQQRLQASSRADRSLQPTWAVAAPQQPSRPHQQHHRHIASASKSASTSTDAEEEEEDDQRLPPKRERMRLQTDLAPEVLEEGAPEMPKVRHHPSLKCVSRPIEASLQSSMSSSFHDSCLCFQSFTTLYRTACKCLGGTEDNLPRRERPMSADLFGLGLHGIECNVIFQALNYPEGSHADNAGGTYICIHRDRVQSHTLFVCRCSN